MHELGLLGARLLVREKEMAEQARAGNQDRLVDQARRSRRLLDGELRSPAAKPTQNRRI
jgi:hypothetical protein